MNNIHANAQCKIRSCIQCEGVTEYHCKNCNKDMCVICKEKHNICLDTKNHEVVIYQAKSTSSTLHETCEKYPKNVNEMVCKECKPQFCKDCTEHGQHKKLDFLKEVEKKRSQHSETIYNIRSEVLYNRQILLACIKNDIKAAQQTKQSPFQTKTMIAKITKKLENKLTCVKFEHKCSIQKMKLQCHLAWIQKHEQIYEQSVENPLMFLANVKKICSSKKYCCPNVRKYGRLSLSEGPTIVNMPVFPKLSFMARPLGNETLLEIMPEPVVKQEFEFKTYVDSHMSFQSPDHIWLYDGDNLVLTNTKGEKLFQIEDNIGRLFHSYGNHTVTREKELIYFDKNERVLKLSKDRTSKSQLPIVSIFFCRAYCVYCSPLTGDLIFGMCNKDTNTCIIKKVQYHRKT